MTPRLLLILLIGTCCSAHCQTIQDPIADCVKFGSASGSYYPGRVYYKWTVDINHDGVNDVLVSLKETSEELAEKKDEERGYFNSNYHGFGVFIGLKEGGYLNSKYVKEDTGDVAGGIGVDLSRCYVGYVESVKQYGIVTVQQLEVSGPSGKGLPIHKERVCCYTVEGDHMKKTILTPLTEDVEESPMYKRYLSDSKRSIVQLDEVRP